MSGPQLGGPGQRLCPSCARFGPESDPTCKHCGYNFDAVSGPSWAGAPIIADQPQNISQPDISRPRSRRSWLGPTFISLLVVGIVSLSVSPLFRIFDSATELFEDLPNIDVEVPEITIPDIDNPLGGDAGSFAKCKKRIIKHLRPLLADDGTGAMGELLTAASQQLGVASFEYRTLVNVFSDHRPTALTQGTRPALRAATRDTTQACRSHYGN